VNHNDYCHSKRGKQQLSVKSENLIYSENRIKSKIIQKIKKNDGFRSKERYFYAFFLKMVKNTI